MFQENTDEKDFYKEGVEEDEETIDVVNDESAPFAENILTQASNLLLQQQTPKLLNPSENIPDPLQRRIVWYNNNIEKHNENDYLFHDKISYSCSQSDIDGIPCNSAMCLNALKYCRRDLQEQTECKNNLQKMNPPNYNSLKEHEHFSKIVYGSMKPREKMEADSIQTKKILYKQEHFNMDSHDTDSYHQSEHISKSPSSNEYQVCKWLQCHSKFFHLEELVNHVNDAHIRAERDLDFKCYWENCPRKGKGFNARYKMLIHVRTHTNEKPYKCDLCLKCFSRLENLKIHNRSHTGERPYLCPFQGCGKAYSNSSDRFKHVRTHQEQKPYYCQMPGCEKRYTDPSSLRKHIKTHGHYFRKTKTCAEIESKKLSLKVSQQQRKKARAKIEQSRMDCESYGSKFSEKSQFSYTKKSKEPQSMEYSVKSDSLEVDVKAKNSPPHRPWADNRGPSSDLVTSKDAEIISTLSACNSSYPRENVAMQPFFINKFGFVPKSLSPLSSGSFEVLPYLKFAENYDMLKIFANEKIGVTPSQLLDISTNALHVLPSQHKFIKQERLCSAATQTDFEKGNASIPFPGVPIRRSMFEASNFSHLKNQTKSLSEMPLDLSYAGFHKSFFSSLCF